MKKEVVVVHSGGMDSSICLALAIQEYGREAVQSLTFSYHQRHQIEVQQAAKICDKWEVDHKVFELPILKELTENALINSSQAINNDPTPNTFVVGRNGLMAHLAGIFAHSVGAERLYMGVMEIEVSGYPDCSRAYMDLKEQSLQIDLQNPHFQIYTPLVHLTKFQSLELAHRMGILEFLFRETVTCYEGVQEIGCEKCPACILRNQAFKKFLEIHPKEGLASYFS